MSPTLLAPVPRAFFLHKSSIIYKEGTAQIFVGIPLYYSNLDQTFQFRLSDSLKTSITSALFRFRRAISAFAVLLFCLVVFVMVRSIFRGLL
jgi:uncharacterized membrane protein YesL